MLDRDDVLSGYFAVALVMEKQDFDRFKKKYQEVHGAEELDEYIRDRELNNFDFIPSNLCTNPFRILPLMDDDYEGVVLHPYFDTEGGYNWSFRYEGDHIVTNPNWNDSKYFERPDLYAVFSRKCMEDVFIGEEEPYASPAELLREYKNELERYLPEDFDWYGSIGVIQYAGAMV